MKSDVHSRLLRIKAKVPMYRLFVKIFLWFWFTVWGILAIVFLITRLTGMRQVTAPNMYATVAPILAAEAVRVYESGGPQAFARFSQRPTQGHEHQLYLLDGYYKDVLSRPITNDGLRVAHAAKSDQLIIFRANIAAYKFISASGHPYILMLYLKSGLRALGDALFAYGGLFSISLFLLRSE